MLDLGFEGSGVLVVRMQLQKYHLQGLCGGEERARVLFYTIPIFVLQYFSPFVSSLLSVTIGTNKGASQQGLSSPLLPLKKLKNYARERIVSIIFDTCQPLPNEPSPSGRLFALMSVPLGKKRTIYRRG